LLLLSLKRSPILNRLWKGSI